MTMPKRVSQSLLDPYFTKPIKGLYSRLAIPRVFPPEGIVAMGHLWAIVGAIGFACATKWWWGGLLAALGVAMNHICDVLDGTHARATDQCRNGGELLDHFVDPLSFSYWIAGIAYGVNYLLFGIAGVIVVYAMAVLTNIKAKMIGEFTLARFGPTEFKTLLILFGFTMAAKTGSVLPVDFSAEKIGRWFLGILLFAGIVQLIVSLVQAIQEVNRSGSEPDTTEWEMNE